MHTVVWTAQASGSDNDGSIYYIPPIIWRVSLHWLNEISVVTVLYLDTTFQFVHPMILTHQVVQTHPVVWIIL